MKIIATIKAKSKEDTLKYAYAFMQSEILNMKECTFMNPKPTHFDKNYILPRDLYTDTYNEDVPSWEIFKNNPTHLSSPGIVCVACLDKEDEKRVMLTILDGDVKFTCYGNYENEAEKVFNSIKSTRLAI